MSAKRKSKTGVSHQTACICCNVHHDSRFCSQCIAAGCNHRGPNESCRQSLSLQALAKLPEWKVREDLAKLQVAYANLTEESQRLVRIIHGVDPKLLDGARVPLPAASISQGETLHG